MSQVPLAEHLILHLPQRLSLYQMLSTLSYRQGEVQPLCTTARALSRELVVAVEEVWVEQLLDTVVALEREDLDLTQLSPLEVQEEVVPLQAALEQQVQRARRVLDTAEVAALGH